jgi:cellulase (glycosyl hydrolase family 5)
MDWAFRAPGYGDAGLDPGKELPPMRLKSVVLLCTLLALAISGSASAAVRMLVGFQDDPSFRWRDDRADTLERAQSVNAQIARTTVYWSRTASTRPANARNPNDPAYNFGDLDEFVTNAELRGMEVMLTIWGTPNWANGGRGQNYAPKNYNDLTNFAYAVARRYSGAFDGLPPVGYFTVWNESNLGQFLSPQYDTSGKPLAPFTYAKLYRAAYAGIKAGNPRALIGIGETSARGRDKALRKAGVSETESPGRFAQLLSTVRPKLQFDAWSQHPYPTELTQKPTALVRWPNVTLSQLGRFETSLDQWFGRKNIPIWITEYGYQTKPQQPQGVTYAQQAAYMRTALMFARNDPRVQMFIWFIFRDDATSAWKSGLLDPNGGKKPSVFVFKPLAALLDGRNPIVTVKGGSRNPVVRVPLPELRTRDGIGAAIGATVRAYLNGKLVGVAQPRTTLAIDGWASFPVPLKTVAGRTYSVAVDVNDRNGNQVSRVVTLISK